MAENETPPTGESPMPPGEKHPDQQPSPCPDSQDQCGKQPGDAPLPSAVTHNLHPSLEEAPASALERDAVLRDDRAGEDVGGNAATGNQLEDNKQQIARLIELHHAELYGYAFRLTGVVADAEDLTQQVFLIAHRKLHQIRDEAATRGWLFQVLRSCFTRLNRRKRPVSAANVDLDVNCVAMEQSTADFDSEALQLALNTLSEEQRQVVTMFYFEELSYLEIADALKIAAGTVMSRLSRAKAKLKQHLDSSPTASRRATEVSSPPGPSSATGGC